MLPSRRQSSRRRRVLAAALVAVALPALSGCASNFDSPVLQQYNPTVGVDIRKGGMWGMNLLVVLPNSGGEGTLVGALLNKTHRTDHLVAAEVRAEPGQGSLGSTLVRSGAAIQPGRLVEMSDPTTVAVHGDVEPGLFVDLTLQFARSEEIHTQVPVVPPEGPYAQVPLPSQSSPSTGAEKGGAAPGQSPGQSRRQTGQSGGQASGG